MKASLFQSALLSLVLGFTLQTSFRVSADDDPKAKLFALMNDYRAAWDAGFAHMRVSGHMSLMTGREFKVWWNKDRTRIEKLNKDGKTEVMMHNPGWTGTANDKAINQLRSTLDVLSGVMEAGHIVDLAPRHLWLSKLGWPLVPIEKWLNSRQTQPVYVTTPEGFAALWTHQEDRSSCIEALETGKSIDSVNATDSIMTFRFSSDGLPLLLDFHGKIPRNPIKIEWEWDNRKPTNLKRVTESQSGDFGKTYQVFREFVVLESRPSLPEDQGLFLFPEPRQKP